VTAANTTADGLSVGSSAGQPEDPAGCQQIQRR
jgi:hypothetical protein